VKCDFVIISMYTPGFYADIVKVLEKSCKKFKLPYKFYRIRKKADWCKTAGVKSKIIQKALRELKKPVLWVDADAMIYNYPYYAQYIVKNYEFDVAHCDLIAGKFPSGTLLFNNTAATRKILKKWDELNNINNRLDQDNLYTILFHPEHVIDYTSIMLPQSYICIFDSKDQAIKTPIVIHYQASRTIKTNGQIVYKGIPDEEVLNG